MQIENCYCEHCANRVKIDQIDAHEKRCKTKYRELCFTCHPSLAQCQPRLFLRLRDRAAANLGIPYRFKGARVDSRFFCLFSRSDKPIGADVKTIVSFAIDQLTKEANSLLDEAKAIK